MSDNQLPAGKYLGMAEYGLRQALQAGATPEQLHAVTSGLLPSVIPGDLAEPLNAAREVLRLRFTRVSGQTLRFWSGEFWLWDGSAYRPMSAEQISATIYEVLEQCGMAPNRRRVGDVAHALQAITLLPASVSPPVWLDDPQRDAATILPCSNGLLDMASGQMLLPSPEFFTVSALPVAHDPDCGEPTEWLRFLEAIWPDDPESVATLQEFIGYLLMPDTSKQKILLIVGPTRSGKGTILRVLTGLLGRDNVAAPTLGSLSQPFGLQALIGKLAAFVSDARLSGRADATAIAERLLSISGEDHVAIPRKFLPDYTATLPARFILATNELPRLSDASGALASRFLVLILRKSFLGKEDAGLTSRLTAELPQILLWAIEGRKRLALRGRFLQPASARDAVDALGELGSPMTAFLRDCCLVGPGNHCKVLDMFSAWQGWCADNGRDHAGTVQSFARDLRAAVPGLRATQPRDNGSRVRVFEGVGLARSGTRSNPLRAVYISSSSEPAIDLHACQRVPEGEA